MKIYSRWDSKRVLYEDASETIRDTVIAAIAARAYLADAYLTDANLADANLTDAYLTDANLADANLTGANLARANLARANLARANLTDANLTDANLADANLTGANLARANLARANLARANLTDANGLPSRVIQIQGSRDFLVTLPDGWVAVGCERYTIEEWLEKGPRIGKENGYSEVQIQEYMIYLRAVAEVLKLDEK